MRALFKSPQLQADFDRDGYVIVPFLDAAQVADLSAHYASLNHDHKTAQGFHVSLDNQDRAFKRGVMDKLQATAQARVEEMFDRAKVFVASYVVKEPGPRGIVPPHQDWTFVDESQFVSCTVWIPLAKTTVDNGALGAIKGSHRLFDHKRASPSPACPTPIGALMFEIFPYLEIQEMEPGQAFIFNNRTLHGSPPNLGDVPRISAGIGITHAEAELVHHYLVPNTDPPQIECYQVEPEFFHQYSNGTLSQLYVDGKRPEGPDCISRETFVRQPADGQALAQMFLRDGNRYDTALAQRMARLFGHAAPAPAVPAAAALDAAPATAPAYVFKTEFPSMKRVLRSDAHQAALERDGYTVVDLLDPTQVIALARHYNAAHPDQVKGMYMATFDPDKARMRADHAHLCSLTSLRLAELMQDIKVVIAGFVVKGPDETSAMGIHQDMTLVDENEFQGINIWCPLVDLDENNGALQVVPGSHRWLKSLRSPTIATLYNEQRVALMRHVQPVYLRAGQAIVFDQSLLHCSPINRSGVQRVVVNMFVTHRDAPMLICHLDPKQADQGVEVFEVDETVMFDFAPFRTEITAHPETGRSLGKVAYAFPSITAGFLQQQFPDPAPGQVQPTPPPSMPANAAALPVAPALVSPQGWRARLRRLVGV